MEHFIQTLSNGLTVLVERMPDVQSAAFNLMVPSGAVHDAAGKEGAAAVLTDWMVRGAGGLDSQHLSDALDRLGLQRHETLGMSHAHFSGALIAEQLPDALRLYGDIVQRPLFDEEEFEGCRLGVEQQLRAIDDDPRQRLYIELRRRCYPSPWGRPADGTVESVESLTPDDVLAHYRRFAKPTDAILSVAGNVDPDEVFAVAETAFGGWPRGESPPVLNGDRGSRLEHLHHDGAQTQVGVAYRSVPFEHAEYYSAWGVVSVLSGGASARLFTEVRDRRGLCYAVSANHSSLRHEAQVLCYVGATNEQAQEALDVMLDVLLTLKDGIGEEELQRCKAGAKSALIMQQESSMSRARTLGSDWYHLGRLTTLDEVRSAIERLTPEMLLSHLNSHPICDFTIVTLGPQPLEVRRAIP